MLDISKRLLYYKRREIQAAIVEGSKDREVGIKYGDNGFGKRPDVLVYENDVLESVKKGATSFHVSEERWNNPLELTTEMRKEDLASLRKGWDLVLDIDCPNWHYSKLTTHLFISALRKHGIKSISCKFSGNKGFHIGVPFEAFPEEINNLPIKNWFPDGPKKVALYLLDYISKNFIELDESGKINFYNLHTTTVLEIEKITKKNMDELTRLICAKCGKKLQKKEYVIKKEFICQKCGFRVFKTDDTSKYVCQKCNILMSKIMHEPKICDCGTKEHPKQVFDPLAIVEVDTILISSRHMFRAQYSMNEKSGLVSIPINPDKVLEFEKISAEPERIIVNETNRFLDASRTIKNEAMGLMTAAFDYGKEDLPYNYLQNLNSEERKKQLNYEDIKDAIPAELFPPCMLKILEGLEDGKKRSLFVLTNFLTSVGWNYDKIEIFLHEWNKKNKPPLHDRDITQQVRYNRQRNKKILPPNCRTYYQDFRVCFPDTLCERIKNPVQYSKKRVFMLNKTTVKRAKLSEEQLAMRKAYREKLKKGKTDNT